MDALPGVDSMFEFGIVGALLIVLFEAVKILGAVVRVKLNGKASPETIPPAPSSAERAIEKLAANLEVYIGEDRHAHSDLSGSLAVVADKVDTIAKENHEMHFAHCSPGAIDPETGSYRWWGVKK